MTKNLEDVRKRAERAQIILNELHREKLDYYSEYLPIIESNLDIDYLISELGKYKALAENGQSAIDTNRRLVERIKQTEG